MKKRIISVGLVLAMVLTMTTTVFAADSKDWESEIDTLGVAVVNNVYYHSLQAAVDAADGGVVKLLAAPTASITVSDELALDLNGFNVTVNGGGALTLTDSSTNEGEVGGKAYGNFQVASRITEKGGISYVVLDGQDDEGTYKTANAVRVQVKKVSIRPSAAGMYYTTSLRFNKNVANYGVKYGVVLSLNGKPTKNFVTEEGSRWTAITVKQDSDFKKDGTSCLLKDILSKNLGADVNAESGKMSVYANAYVMLNIDGVDTFIMAENTSPLDYSLQYVMKYFDTTYEAELRDWDGVAELSNTTKNLLSFFESWYDSMTYDSLDWGLENLKVAYSKKNAA